MIIDASPFRIFIGIELPPVVRSFVCELRSAVAPVGLASNKALDWSRDESWHVTLYFVGNTSRDNVERIQRHLDLFASSPMATKYQSDKPLSIHVENKFGLFPNKNLSARNMRILFACARGTTEADSEKLALLSSDLEQYVKQVIKNKGVQQVSDEGVKDASNTGSAVSSSSNLAEEQDMRIAVNPSSRQGGRDGSRSQAKNIQGGNPFHPHITLARIRPYMAYSDREQLFNCLNNWNTRRDAIRPVNDLSNEIAAGASAVATDIGSHGKHMLFDVPYLTLYQSVPVSQYMSWQRSLSTAETTQDSAVLAARNGPPGLALPSESQFPFPGSMSSMLYVPISTHAIYPTIKS